MKSYIEERAVEIANYIIQNNATVRQAAKKYGNQCVVLSMDVKRVDGKFQVFVNGGRVNTGIDAAEWAHFAQEEGAGELVLNSIDTDGVKNGFDIEMLNKICNRLSIPVIASGGAGSIQHFKQLFRQAPKADAGLAASIFHFKQVDIKELKRQLKADGVSVRI